MPAEGRQRDSGGGTCGAVVRDTHTRLYAKITNGCARVSFAVGLSKSGAGSVPADLAVEKPMTQAWISAASRAPL